MKKRIVILIMVGTMALSLLVGCGSKETSNSDVPNTEVTENMATNENLEDAENETEIVTEETEATEVVEETQVETTEQPTTTYTYEDMSATMYAKQSVNVRNLPSTDGEKLGALSYAQEVTVTGKCVETGWYRIDFNGSVGYVSNNYLLTEKPAEQPVVPSEPTEPSQPAETNYIQKFYETYGGSWDSAGVDVGAGMCTGRSLYTNSVYNTSFKISTNTRVCNDRFIVDMNDASPSDGVTTECIDDGYIWLAGTVEFDLYLYTLKNTKWSVESETSFINSYEAKHKETYANSYDVISFGEIYTMNIGGNTYYCVNQLDMNVRDIGNVYYYETLLVRKCGDKMLVYYIKDSNNQIGVDSGGVTESYIRERILY